MRPRSLIRLLAALAVGGAAIAVGVTTPASALQQETLVLERGKEAKATYGPIVGNYPGTTAAVPEPHDCGNPEDYDPTTLATPPAFTGTCDTVPIKVIPPPGLGATEDYLVTITITWNPMDYVEDPSGEVGDTPVNDLDVYFYDNKQIAKETDPEADAWTNLGESINFGGPETIKLFSPTLIDYNLVVINLTGPNVDYTVEAKMEIDGFESPFEDLGPTFAPRRTAARNDASDNLVAPLDFSGDDDGGSGTGDADDAVGDFANVFTGSNRTLEEVPLLPDSDFSSLSGESDFESQLAAPSPFGAEPAELTRVVRDASPVVVGFWLVIAPLVILGVLVLFFVRRNRSAFSFA